MANKSSKHRITWALSSSALLVLAAWSGPVHALNLGRLQVLSGLGDPLHAEVAVVDATAAELSGLQAQVAPPALFTQSGMEFSPALQGATVSLQTREGLPFLVVQGKQPVKDTFLDLIVQAQWNNGGKLRRNYALLLNSMAPNRPRANESVSAAQLPVSSNSLSATTTPVAATSTPTPLPSTASSAASAVHAPAAQERSASPRADGPVAVNTGDTASEIAVRNLPESVSLDQMLVAMAKANPDAFIEGNVNLVRAGSSLRMPSSGEAQSVSRQEARQIVLAQTRDFVAYTQRLARTPVQVDQTSTSEMSGRLSTPQASVNEAEGKPDRLTLSQATVSDAQESQIAKEQEGKDKKSELDALQKSMAELQDLAKNKETASGVGVNLPAPDAKAPEASTPSDTSSTSNVLETLKNDPRTLGWAAALLAAMLALAWWVRRSHKRGNAGAMAYSPSYDDIPATANIAPSTDPTASVDVPPGMPAGLSGLNLDLSSPPSAPVPASVAPMVMPTAPVAPAASEPTTAPHDTGANKLQLAQQLLQQGEKDLARALLLSAIKSTNPSVQTQALQLLNTLQ